MIHVSQLKKDLPPSAQVNSDELLHIFTVGPQLQPVQVLATRLQLVGNAAMPYGLVQWSGCPVEWATWENMNRLSVHDMVGYFALETSCSLRGGECQVMDLY
jgi:hypothetical protein